MNQRIVRLGNRFVLSHLQNILRHSFDFNLTSPSVDTSHFLHALRRVLLGALTPMGLGGILSDPAIAFVTASADSKKADDRSLRAFLLLDELQVLVHLALRPAAGLRRSSSPPYPSR